MERDPNLKISTSLDSLHAIEWQEVLSDNDLAVRLDELVDLTQKYVDVTENPWAQDRAEVSTRWQYATEVLGVIARSHSHPLFSHGRGWTDEARVAEVLEPVDFRSLEAGFIENSLLLTHSLALKQQQTNNPGLSVNLNTLNNVNDNQSPELIEHFTCIIDLRDMAPPTETVIGDMTLEDYKQLSEEERNDFSDRLLKRVVEEECYGKGYGFVRPPQRDKYLAERRKLVEYCKLLEYGTIDNKEIEQILDERKAEEVARLRKEHPDFGKVPDDFSDLPERARECITEMFAYFNEMRERYEIVGLSTYNMRRLGFEDEDLNQLKQAGVLVNEEYFPSPDGPVWNYQLAQPYYECWVSRHYPAE